ncbi:MAG: MFS transporter [Zetaproteobacteria bacterium]|jgi:MFS transporter, FHS family, Na+ dependent glucose transporter 1|nr:MAG: MFS transporter [Zetaproteobacteria bacterium]
MTRSDADPAANPRQALFKTAGYFAAFVALGLASASLGPTLPGLAENTGSRFSEISSLFAARSLGYLAGSLVGGRLYDRVPGHPVMAAGLLLMAGMMGMAPVVPQLWMLSAAILVLGFAEGALDVGGNTLLVWVHRDRVGPFMNALHFCFGLGAFLSPLIIAQVLLRGGDLVRAYWTLALLLLPAVFWLPRLSSPRAPDISTGGVASRANGRLVALIVAFFFLYTGAEIAFGGWIYSYAVALRLSSDAVAAYLTSTFWGALTLGRLVAVPLAVRFPAHTILLADCLGCLTSLAILLLGSHSLSATFAGTCGLGLSMASIFPAALSLAQGRMRITGQVTGWFFVGASAGGMVLPWLIGQFFESVGPRVTIAILLVDMTGATAVLAVLTLRSARPVYHWLTDPR